MCLTQIFALTESDTPVGQPQFDHQTVHTPHQPPGNKHPVENLPDKSVFQLTHAPPTIQASLLRMDPIHTTLFPYSFGRSNILRSLVSAVLLIGSVVISDVNISAPVLVKYLLRTAISSVFISTFFQVVFSANTRISFT